MVRRLAWGLVLFIGIGFDLSARPLIAADYAATEQLYFEGQYEACMSVAAEEVAKNIWNDRWPQLLIRCQMTLGRYAEARETFEKSIKQFTSGSVGLRLLGYEVYRANNEPRLADEQLSRIEVAVSQSDVRFTSNENLVAIGRFLDLVGEDARKILELIYDRIRKNDPNFAEVYVASAELALNKYDYKVAAESLEKALALRPNDPYIAYLAAQAWMPSDEERAQVYLIRALTLNPRHVPAQLMVIDRMIDAEKYTEAKEKLTQVFGVNLAQPEAWAYHAVIAHLQGYSQAEKLFHAIAQERWRNHAMSIT